MPCQETLQPVRSNRKNESLTVQENGGSNPLEYLINIHAITADTKLMIYSFEVSMVVRSASTLFCFQGL